MKNYWLLVSLLVVSLAGCADREKYYEAMTKQNDTIQLRDQQRQAQKDYDRVIREKRREEHQVLMAQLMTKMMDGAAKTSTPVDDIMGPVLFMVMEDKFATVELVAALGDKDSESSTQQLQTIEAPEETGDIIAKSSAVVLGVVGIGANILNNDINAKTLRTALDKAGSTYTVSGENNKMNVDSFKSGSDNIVTAGGDSTITGGDTTEGCSGGDCEDEESESSSSGCSGADGYFVDDDGYAWVQGASDTLSCDSWLACHGVDSGGNWASGCDPDEEEEE